MIDKDGATSMQDLMAKLAWALQLTKADAEKNGFAYGPQSTCVKALRAYERWTGKDAP